MPLVGSPTFTINQANPPGPGVGTSVVRVHDGTDWQEIIGANSIRIVKRVGGGQASFFVPDATVALADLMRTGRECEITYVVDGNTVEFGGYIHEPERLARTPLHFDMNIKVQDLTHGATWAMVRRGNGTLGDTWAAGTDFVDIMTDIFSNSWFDGNLNLSVDANPIDTSEEYQIHFEILGRAADKIVKEFLKDWVWWIGHDGAVAGGLDKRLFVQERGANDLTLSVVLTEDDIHPKFRMKPVVTPMSDIYFVGDDDPLTDEVDPLLAASIDAASNTAYGRRESLTRSQETKNTLDLLVQAQGLGEQRNYDLLETKLRVFDWSLKPSDKILLFLPTVGVNDGAGAVPWVVDETEDRFHQGRARRWITLKETRAAAVTRVG